MLIAVTFRMSVSWLGIAPDECLLAQFSSDGMAVEEGEEGEDQHV